MGSTEHQRQIIDTFVNSVYVFDDRVVLNFNFTDDAKTVTREEVLGSSAVDNAPPKSTKVPAFVLLFCSFIQFFAHLAANLFAPLVLDLRVSRKGRTGLCVSVLPTFTRYWVDTGLCVSGFCPIAADPAFCRKLHQIPPFAQ